MTEIEAKDIPFELKEFRRLEYLLTNADIPFEEIITKPVGNLPTEYYHLQICYPNQKYKISDVVIFRGSYGVDEGTLEMMGLVNQEEVGDTVQGHMTADEVFAIWKSDWERRVRGSIESNY